VDHGHGVVVPIERLKFLRNDGYSPNPGKAYSCVYVGARRE
jgi:hypothetical protein